MNRSEMIKEMRITAGDAAFINRRDIAKYLGYKDPHSIDKLLTGLERIGSMYFIPDVVDSIRQASVAR